MKKSGWTRGEKLALVAVLVAIIAIPASFLIPEVRRFFHLEKPTQEAKQPPLVPLIHQDAPAKTGEDKSSPSVNAPQTIKQNTKVKHIRGNNNVAGNNVSGSNNATGNNNSTAPVAIAPNGIAITGGTVTNPTVNNYNPTPTARRLTNEQKTELIECLKGNPGGFTVGSIINNGEAYKYALDFYEVLSAAQWKNEWGAPVASFMIGGGMWSGVRLSLPGTWDEATQHATLKEDSPEVTLRNCLNKAKVGGIAIPEKDMKTGSIRIDVSDHP